MSGLESIGMWYRDPGSRAIMRNCGYTDIGVWSENSLERTVVVAVYGQPPQPAGTSRRARLDVAARGRRDAAAVRVVGVGVGGAAGGARGAGEGRPAA